MVSISWLGHACFKIDNSKTIVTDPHDGKGIGLNPPEAKADIVTVSHGHFDHADGVNLVKKPDSVMVRGSGSQEIKGIQIKGIDSYHDKSKGSKRGENTIFLIEVDGTKICHLGDLGHELSDEKVKEIGKVDVLIVPVGGNYTINGIEAMQVVEKIDPDVVIPMHYKIPGLTVDIDDEKKFISSARGKGYRVTEEIKLDVDEVQGRKVVVKMKC